MIVIGPTTLAGIGQVCVKYSELFRCKRYLTIEDPLPVGEDIVFIFALPIPLWIDRIPILKRNNKKVICMTVCETETVHPAYGLLFEHFDLVAVPSEFCRGVFSRQFPQTRFELLYHFVPPSVPKKSLTFGDNLYKFYHIGNIVDPRKQCKKIIEAFIRLNKPDTLLVLKASCKEPVNLKIPRVVVINQQVDNDYINSLHKACDCYVSFSHSEGVGMGAVEAAMHDKPVILSEYGGATEYVKTPYVVPCEKVAIGVHDFLYTPDLVWGDPNFGVLLEHMTDCYNKRLTKWDHSHTRSLLSAENITGQFQKIVDPSVTTNPTQ